jgi:hypothetical protein
MSREWAMVAAAASTKLLNAVDCASAYAVLHTCVLAPSAICSTDTLASHLTLMYKHTVL